MNSILWVAIALFGVALLAVRIHPAQRGRRRERLQLRILGRLMLDRAAAEELDYLFEFWDGTSFLYEMMEAKLIVRKEKVFCERPQRFHYRYYYEITPLGQRVYRDHLRRYALPRMVIRGFEEQETN